MRQLRLVVLAVGVAAGCTPPSSGDGGTPTPPVVFITVANSVVIDTSIKGNVTTNGCKKVAQVELDAQGTFLADANYTSNPTAWEIPAQQLSRFYPNLGLAASLELTAVVHCDDGRKATSQPAVVKFMPVASVVEGQGGLMLPDSFVAEGGLGGPTTFIGCVGTATGATLARVDQAGNLIAQLTDAAGNPWTGFGCTNASVITDRNAATRTRWLMEPKVGVLAFDSNLKVTASATGDFRSVGVSKNDGNAIVYMSGTPTNTLFVLRPTGGTTPVVWSVPTQGMMNSTPLVNNGELLLSFWQFDSGTNVGEVVAYKLNYFNGAQIASAVLLHQSFGAGVDPIPVAGTIEQTGQLFYMPLLQRDVATGNVKTVVAACPLNVGPGVIACEAATKRWYSRLFDGVLSTVVPFSGSNYLAAAGPYATYFLSTADGTVKNAGEVPLRPEGSMQVQSLISGPATDFYLLDGPPGQWPTEIVATDKPENGELWRVQFGTGESPTAGLYLAIDDGGNVWLRVGANQVKMLGNLEYRTARGATTP